MKRCLLVVETPYSLSLSAILMLVALAMTTLGCSDYADEFVEDDIDTASQTVTSPCTPARGYEDCLEIDLSQLEYWQDTLSDPDWRTVEPNPDPDIDYDVIIDVDQLNGGIIPTKYGQGYYKDWQDFYDTKSDLLGVDYKNDTFNLIIFGSTVKEVNGGSTHRSYGFFPYDALSNRDGAVIVDGTNEAMNIFNFDRRPFFIQTGSTTSSDTDNDSSDSTLLSNGPWQLELQDSALLEDSNWRANLKMFHREGGQYGGEIHIPSKVSLQLDSMRANYFGTWFGCDWQWSVGFVQRMCNTANVDALLEVAQPNHQLVPVDAFPPVDNVRMVTIDYVHDVQHIETVEACGGGYADFPDPAGTSEDYVFSDDVEAKDCPLLGSEHPDP